MRSGSRRLWRGTSRGSGPTKVRGTKAKAIRRGALAAVRQGAVRGGTVRQVYRAFKRNYLRLPSRDRRVVG